MENTDRIVIMFVREIIDSDDGRKKRERGRGGVAEDIAVSGDPRRTVVAIRGELPHCAKTFPGELELALQRLSGRQMLPMSANKSYQL